MIINPHKTHMLYNTAHKIIHKHLFIKIYASKENTLKMFLWLLLDYSLSPVLSQYYIDERNLVQSEEGQFSIAVSKRWKCGWLFTWRVLL